MIQASTGPTLTERQTEVVRLVAEGLKRQAIASRLGISIYTVDYHLREISARSPGSGRPTYRAILLANSDSI